MIKFAPYISIYDLDQKIEFQNEVLWTFSKNLKGISSQRQRFNIHLVNKKIEERKWLDGSIKSIWKYFDQTTLIQDDIELSKLKLLNLIKDSFLEISKELNWNTDKIYEAHNRSLEENIEFNYQSKNKLNKSRTRKGFIEMELDGNKVLIWGIILNTKNAILFKQLLIETFTHQVDWFRTFNNFKWINDKEFGFDFGQKLILTISENENGAKWNTSNSEDNKGFIRSVTYQTFGSEKERIEWINK